MPKYFLENRYKDIQGITVIESGETGPNIGILAITHGNEPVGLTIFDNLINRTKLSNSIIRGKVLLIAVNIKAFEQYQNGNNTARFIDHNMNRIHGKQYKHYSYEFQRKKELETILDELDIVVDLHSVPKGEDLICITDERNMLVKDIFDVETILFDDISSSGALIGYLTSQGKMGFGLECGNHTSSFGYINGMKNVLNLLGYYGVIDKNYFDNTKFYQQISYRFLEEIYPKSELFNYTKDFRNFDKLLAGDIFGIDGDTKYINTYNKPVYIGFIKKNIIANDGCGFLFERLTSD